MVIVSFEYALQDGVINWAKVTGTDVSASEELDLNVMEDFGEKALSDFDEEDHGALSASALSHVQKSELLRAASNTPRMRGRGRPPKSSTPVHRPPSPIPMQIPEPTLGVPVVALNPTPIPDARSIGEMPMGTPKMEMNSHGIPMPSGGMLRSSMPPGAVPLSQMPAPSMTAPALIAPPPMPTCPWFNPCNVSEEEVRELSCSFPALRQMQSMSAEQMTADHSAVSYLQLRNTLIDIYRRRPQVRLTLAECRKHCDGDLSALLRILSFLERNRLINYALETDTTSSTVTDPATTKLKEDLRNHWTKTPTCSACDRICLYTFFVLSPSIYGSNLPLAHLRTALWCSDCAREAPHNQCLLKVNLPALHVSGGAVSWSEQQTNALFDAIEEHGADWLQIAKLVSSVPGNPLRTPRDCLAAFLSMPLAEQPIAFPSSSALSSTRDVTANDSPVKSERSPADAGTEKAVLQLLFQALDILSNNTQTPTELTTLALGALQKLQQQNGQSQPQNMK